MTTPALDPSWTWRSWIESANDPESGFPLQNLPFCAFRIEDGTSRLGSGIGDSILDLRACSEAGLLHSLPEQIRNACCEPVLNALMSCEPAVAAALRQELLLILREDADRALIGRIRPFLRPQRAASFCKPVNIGDYTDFYASIHHATNVGRLFRPDQPLFPNYKFVPIGYHGRASSIVISDMPVRRPRGQIKLPSENTPTFQATRQLDFELEVGSYIASGNPLGQPITIDDAEQHLFGISLVNDWSARDIQAWEYQPLGPFLGKSFATSVSPWVVTAAALHPFRSSLAVHAEVDPEPLPYLRSPEPQFAGIDLELKAHVTSAAMRERSLAPVQLSSTNLLNLYWSFGQMVTHHTGNGCNLRPGDLIASGTISGPTDGSLGCLLEITRRGSVPLALPTGEIRSFLEDGDEVILSGGCRLVGLPFISLGECRGTVVPTDE